MGRRVRKIRRIIINLICSHFVSLSLPSSFVYRTDWPAIAASERGPPTGDAKQGEGQEEYLGREGLCGVCVCGLLLDNCSRRGDGCQRILGMT